MFSHSLGPRLPTCGLQPVGSYLGDTCRLAERPDFSGPGPTSDVFDQRAFEAQAPPTGHQQHDGMLRHFVGRLVAQNFLDEGERPLLDDEALLASIATDHALLPRSAISKHEF